jgi:UDP-N-acetylglucosamine diphosphorylase/glucosamine-1-phosphate N-acetyltransferase
MTTKTKAILFDDSKGVLSPLNDLRPTYAIRTGPLTISERLTLAFDLEPIGVVVPHPMVELTQELTALPVNTPPELDQDGNENEEILLISARCPLPVRAITEITLGQVLIEEDTQDMIAVRLTRAGVRDLLTGNQPEMMPIAVPGKHLMNRPWDWRHFRDASIEFDLQVIAQSMPKVDEPPIGVTIIGTEGVALSRDAMVMPGVILNATAGPIVIEENATIHPGAIITGPAYIGPGSTVLEQANIKPNTAIGPVCKVAGEVGGTVFQGYANKAHAGHLGDSWIGEWANLGADTTNSNLLNTYGQINARATSSSSMEKTKQTFLGVTMGDHVKTAIATRIMTGAIAHTGTMFAASTAMSGTTAPFSWHTDTGVKNFRLGKFVDVSLTAMERRGIKQSQAYSRRVTVLHETETGQEAFSWPGKDVSHLGKS